MTYEYTSQLTYLFARIIIVCYILTAIFNSAILAALRWPRFTLFLFGARRSARFQQHLCVTMTPATRIYVIMMLAGVLSGVGLMFCYLVNSTNVKTHLEIDIFFWVGSLYVNYYAISSVPIFFMTLDRCIILLNATRTDAQLEERRARITAASIVLMATIFVLSEVIFLMELPLDYDELMYCVTFPCLARRFKVLPQITVRIIFGGANLALSFFFLRLRRRFKYVASLSNFTVITAISMEFFFTILPSFINYVFTMITGESLTRHLGPINSLSQAFESLACTLLYLYIVMRPRRAAASGVNTQVTTQIHSASPRDVALVTISKSESAPNCSGPTTKALLYDPLESHRKSSYVDPAAINAFASVNHSRRMGLYREHIIRLNAANLMHSNGSQIPSTRMRLSSPRSQRSCSLQSPKIAKWNLLVDRYVVPSSPTTRSSSPRSASTATRTAFNTR